MNRHTLKQRIALVLTFLAVMTLLSGCEVEKKKGESISAADPAGSVSSEEKSLITEWQITDDLGRTVTGTEKSVKAAALTASFAQTWLLAGGELAAAPTDAWEDLKLDLDESVRDLGKYNEINQEMLFLSEPDLVIASSKTSNHMELMDALERTGIPSVYFEVNSFDDYLRMLKICTDITGREDLYKTNGTAVEERVNKAIQTAQKSGKTPKVLLLRTTGMGVKAKGSDGAVAGLILRDLGCINIADGSDLLDELSLEKIIEEDPEYIFIIQQGNDQEESERAIRENLSGNPAWKELSAVKEDRVFWLDRYLYQFKPNNRWGEAYEGLEEILFGTE